MRHYSELNMILVALCLRACSDGRTLDLICAAGMLQHFLAAHDLALPVTGETDKMSIGGTLNGTGIESSSHR